MYWLVILVIHNIYIIILLKKRLKDLLARIETSEMKWSNLTHRLSFLSD